MISFFEKRTKEHIDLVTFNMELMEGYLNLSLDVLRERGVIHDASKYGESEREGYVWLSWWHLHNSKLKTSPPFEYPPGISKLVQKAVSHHLGCNRHHPESFTDCNAMTELDIVEMACDMTAISVELGQESCHHYYITVKFPSSKFNQEKENMLLRAIEELDRRRANLGKWDSPFVQV